ncbi:MAG: radical SAM protein [Victivallales bacterium]|nr:radical SAM protein [Victivallales bacterium]
MDSASLIVNEKFLSIQGESTHAGRLCYFIRLAGCNLSCAYCDTLYAQDAASGQPETVASLLAAVRDSGCRLVEITGGEPLTSAACPELCEALIYDGFEVLVETNGSLDVSVLPEKVIKIVDCKTPSSGEAGKMLAENYTRLSERDEIKFVIADRNDYEYSLEVINRYQLDQWGGTLIFSAAWAALDPQTLVEWMVADRAPARLQLQMHKYIWGSEKKGV